MSNIAIKVENLGKKYVINHEHVNGDDNFREVIIRNTKKIITSLNPFSKLSVDKTQDTTEDFWALSNLSFEIKKGDRVGIIGRNGAGKSTLLKVLSRITEPTTGKIHINGRIASLLEVGTGFHPELTGRENIYLNGAILGMSRKEIQVKFDEIVDFAEVERFIDTPVKRYSSGMYVRLAFSVAAHLEPEILIIDEVLAVGDTAFQKKCLGKLDDMGEEGRTVLFVSHNIAMISSLCNKGLFFEKGELQYAGGIEDTVACYFNNNQAVQGEIDYSTEYSIPGDDKARLLEVSVKNNIDEIKSDVQIDEEIHISMKYELLEDDMKVYANFHFYTSDGACSFVSFDGKLDPELSLKLHKGKYISTCIIPANFLNDGIYFIGFALTTATPVFKVHFYERDALQLHVIDKIDGIITRSNYSGPMPGAVRPSLNWRCEKI